MQPKYCCQCGRWLRTRIITEREGGRGHWRDWCYMCYRRIHAAPRVDTRKGYNG